MTTDCKGYICGNFDKCECETRDIEVELENLRTEINDVARMNDEVLKYLFNMLIDQMLEIQNLVSKIERQNETF